MTAAVERTMPMMILAVSGSPKAMDPTRMAVIGSKTPITEALVAPMVLVATANVAVETMVGNSARQTSLLQAPIPSIHSVRGTPLMLTHVMKSIAPTVSV